MQNHDGRFSARIPSYLPRFVTAALDSTILLLAVATVVALLPFSKKAFHIDDSLFVWTAHQIQKSPFNFYGFEVNWYGAQMAASDVVKNPPLASYYIAIVANIVGWGERRLHLAFILPAVAAVIGMYFLSRRYCSRPGWAALTLLFTPVFLVSSTNVMCDTMMLAFWLWAFVFWDTAIRNDSLGWAMLAGVFAAACALTKYFGVCLLPLMLVYAIAKKPRFGLWFTAFWFPILVIGLYEWYTHALYQRGLFGDAAGYAAHFARTDLVYTLVGLAFVGGSVLSPIGYSPLAWSRRWIIVALGVLAIVALVLFRFPPVPVMDEEVKPDRIRLIALELAVFAVIGTAMLITCASDLWRRPDADSLLLFLWVIGTFIFATFLNWTINARSLLPMAPAIIIVFMRRLDIRFGPATKDFEQRLAGPVLVAAAISLSVAFSDYTLANSSRIAAYFVHEKTKGELGAICFEGHWGFQVLHGSTRCETVEYHKRRALRRRLPGHAGQFTKPCHCAERHYSEERHHCWLEELDFYDEQVRWSGILRFGLGAIAVLRRFDRSGTVPSFYR